MIMAKGERPYPIVFRSLSDIGAVAREQIGGKRAFLASDACVYVLYGECVKTSLEEAGYAVTAFPIELSETRKNRETLFSLWDALAAAEICRSDAVIALGGGVTTDIVGFAAATYLRGVPFLSVPTTLLAMTDAAIGGKNGIDLPAGKNLAGTFYAPAAVVCDESVLSTLPEREMKSGYAELIKYAMIGDRALLDSLLSGDNTTDALAFRISSAVRDKCDVVAEDFLDKGKRRLLNFGHTVGHAVEYLSDYRLSHGEAVAIGMAVVTRAAVRAGRAETKVQSTLEKLLALYGLPMTTDFTAEEIVKAVKHDKKSDGQAVTLILPVGLCEVSAEKISYSDLLPFIRGGLAP